MTGNRFTFAYETNDQYCIWWAVRDGDISLWKEEVVSLLNQLNDENEQLKAYTGEMEDYLARLEEKNKHLKKQNKELQVEIEKMTDLMADTIQKKGDLLSEINNGRKRKRKVKADNKVDYIGLSKDDIVKK